MSINNVVVGGRLTKDPELRYTPSGVAVCTFTLASDRNFKNSNGERETDFIPVVVYRQLAEMSANALAKGKKSTVAGRLQVRSFVGQDGQKHWVTEVVADTVDFPPKESGNYQSEGNYQAQGNYQQQSQGNYNQQSQNNFSQGQYNDQGEGQNWGENVQFNDDDIPFA